MEILVFVPGIMGSELIAPDGEKVWPPTPLEVMRGYKRTDKLISPHLRPGGVIGSVCIDVYKPFLDAMKAAGYRAEGPRRLVSYPYDWRRDLADLSDEFEGALAGVVAQHGPDVEIKIVCHSMGGLVARGCLEKPRGARPAWMPAVRLCAFMATPHDGAPLAFARAIGVGGGSLGLSPAQLRQVAGAAGYPAGYQLFPAEDLTPIWTLDEATPFRGVSLFSPETADAYPLNPAHMATTTAFRARLDPARRPVGCRYFAIVSAAHETVTRFNQEGGTVQAVKVKASGDGTVPITSATALRIQTAYVDANHIGVAQKPITHRLLKMLLGVIEPDVIAVSVEAGGQPALSLSERAITEGDAYEIVIVAGVAGALDGTLAIKREEEGGAFRISRTLEVTVTAEGAQRLTMNGPALGAGRYRFVFTTAAGIADVEDLVVMARNTDA